MSVNMTSPKASFRINESEPEVNYTYTQSCTAFCDDKPQNCSEVYLYAEYNLSTASSINTTSSFLRSLNDSYYCGNLTAGGAGCSFNFTVMTTLDSGATSWNVWCKAGSRNVGSYNSPENVNVTVNDHPHAAFTYPSANSWLHGVETLNASASYDDSAISRYVFELDNNTAFDSYSLLCNTTQENCSFDTTAQSQCIEQDSDCYLKLSVSDNEGLENSTVISIAIDNTPPSITLNSPSEGGNLSSSLVFFNYTPSDPNLESCTLWHNFTSWNANRTDYSPANNIYNYFNSTFTDGYYKWNVECNDSFGDRAFASSNISFMVDLTGPSVFLESPANASFSIGNLTFYYNASDELSAIDNCSLFIDGSLNITNSTITEGASQNFTIIGLDEGNHSWRVSCYDTLGNHDESAEWIIRIDNTGPVVVLDLPVQGANLSSGNQVLNATANDAGAGVDVVTFEYRENSTANWTFVCDDPSEPYSCLQDTSAMDELPTYQIRAYAKDKLGNLGAPDVHTSITIDKTPPNLTIISPPNNTRLVNGVLNFTFNVSDNLAGVINCSLLFSGAVNRTNTTINESLIQRFSYSDLPDGQYNWSISCYDYSGNRQESAERNLSIAPDTTPPVITLISPEEDQTITTSDVTFYYNVSDELSDIANCSLFINGTLNKTSTNVQQGITQSFFVPDMEDGSYNWQVNCTDTAASPNTGSSSVVNFTVFKTPHLNLSLSLERETYQLGEIAVVTVNTTDPFNNPVDANVSLSVIHYSNKTLVSTIPWWNSSFGYRMPLNITASSENISGNYTLNATIDTQTLIQAGKMRADGSDLRVVWWDPLNNMAVELDRLVSSINTSTTIVNFRSQRTIKNGTSNYNYYIYYGDASADNPPVNRSNVYFYYDGFSYDSLDSYTKTRAFDSDAEDANSTVFWNSTGKWVEYNGTDNNAKSIRRLDLPVRNAVIDVMQNGDDPYTVSAKMELGARVNGDSYYYFWVPINVYTPEIGRYVNGDKTQLATGNGTFAANTWHKLEFKVYDNESTVFLTAIVDGSVVMSYNDSSSDRLLSAGGFGVGAYQFVGKWDNLSVRLFSTAPPVVSSLPEESFIEGNNSNTVGGTMTYNVDTFTLKYGNYSSAALGVKQGYINDDGYEFFSVVPDTTKPSVNLVYPGNDTFIGSSSVNLTYLPSDNSRHFNNCTLYLDSVENQTNTSIMNGLNNTFPVDGLSSGTYKWSVSCYDYSNNSNTSLEYIFKVDLEGPAITLHNPINGFNTTNSSVVFNFTAVDNFASVLNCSITAKGNVIASGITAYNGTPTNITASVQPGFTDWNVSCSDKAGNPNVSLTRQLVLLVPPSSLAITYVNFSYVNLSWEAVEGAESYNIYYSTNHSDFDAVPNISGVTTNYHVLKADTPLIFFRISSARSSLEAKNTDTLGKYIIPLETGFNLVGSPLNLSHKQLGDVSVNPDPLPASPSFSIRSVYRLMSANESWQRVDYVDGFGWDQAVGSEAFTELEDSRGYWLETNESCNLTFLGRVVVGNMSRQLYKTWTLASWMSLDSPELPTGGEPPYYPIVVSPINSVYRIYYYNATTDVFKKTDHYDGWGWWPASGSSDFTTLTPGEGYYFKLNNDAEWTVEANR